MKPRTILMFVQAILLISLIGCAAKPQRDGARAGGDFKTLVTYPSGAFLENLTTTPRGEVLFTHYYDKRLMLIDGHGAASVFADLPIHPAGVALLGEILVVGGHGSAFTSGPGFMSTNRLLLLDTRGRLRADIAVPQARLLNGIAFAAPDLVLVADSLSGTVLSLRPSSGLVSVWMADASMRAADSGSEHALGVNGLKVHEGWLYFSNWARGALYRVRLTSTGAPAGSPEVFATAGPVDDFTFENDGSLLAASNGTQVLRIRPDGSSTALNVPGLCDGCTSMANRQLADGSRELVILNTGGLLFGGTRPAAVVALPLP